MLSILPETGEKSRDEIWAAFNSTLEPVFAAGSLGVVLFQVICLRALRTSSFFLHVESSNLYHETRYRFCTFNFFWLVYFSSIQ
jgi:hypothetical protein